MRKENGITLIALILIVLLIFIAVGAVVVITSSNNGEEDLVAGKETLNYEVTEDYVEEDEDEEEEELKFDAEHIAEYLKFEFNDSEKTATITGIKDEYALEDSDGEIIPAYIKVGTYVHNELDLPSVVEKNGKKYKVTKIGNDAFKDNSAWGSQSRFTKIVIPEGVEEIGDYAFYNCNSLIDLSLPESLTTIGEYAFAECGYLVEVKLPESVTTMKMHAFDDCESLESIKIPSGVKEISSSLFYNCGALKNIELPEGLEYISGYAFEKTGIEELVIPKNTQYINEFAIRECPFLQKITFLGDVERIDKFAIYDCPSLTTVIIKSGVKFIDYDNFIKCDNLTDIYCEDAEKPEEWVDDWYNERNTQVNIHWGSTEAE